MLARERANAIPASDFKEILPNHERNPLEELSALADEEGEQIEEEKEKSPRIETSREETSAAATGAEARKNSTDELEAELEMDLDNLKLDDIDTTDVNLHDEDLLED